MPDFKFATAVNCMDGRVQEPVSRWIKGNYGVDYVDMITEAGPDKVMTEGPAETVELIKKKVFISVNARRSKVIVMAGHYDCWANPASKEKHVSQIKEAVKIIENWGVNVPVAGIYVNEQWQVEEVKSAYPEEYPV